MRIGSLVVMVEPLGPIDIAYLFKVGAAHFPSPSPRELTVSKLERARRTDGCEQVIGICLEEYPEIDEAQLLLDASLFREVQAPGEINIGELLKECIPLEHV